VSHPIQHPSAKCCGRSYSPYAETLCSDLVRGLPEAVWEDWGMLGKSLGKTAMGRGPRTEQVTPGMTLTGKNQVYTT